MKALFKSQYVALLAISLSITTTGCVSNLSMQPLPKIELIDRFSESGSEPAPPSWWEHFSIAEINRIVSLALRENQDIHAARFNYMAAIESVAAEQGTYIPDMGLELSQQTLTQANGSQKSITASLTGGAYELDLWGRIGATIDSAKMMAESQLWHLHSLALQIAELAVIYSLRYIAITQKIELQETQIQTNQTLYESMTARLGMGQIKQSDLLRQQQLVLDGKEKLIRLRQEKANITTTLANITSQMRGRLVEEVKLNHKLPAANKMISTEIPSTVIARRPDVQAMLAQLKAANYDIAIAVSERFPRISLSASRSSEANSASKLFENWSTNLMANLVGPLIDGGTRRAEVRRRRALFRKQVHTYTKAVINAVNEIEDLLATEIYLTEALSEIKSQLAASQMVLEQLRLEYLNGVSDFFEYLSAIEQLQSLEQRRIDTELSLLETRAALLRSMSGPIDENQFKQSQRE